MANFEYDALTQKIIGCCLEVHNILGPGFNEKIYAKALQIQPTKAGLGLDIEKEFNVEI